MSANADRSKIIFETTTELYPVVDSIVTPNSDMPESSSEDLAHELAKCEGIKRIASIVLLNSGIENHNSNESSFSLRSLEPDLPMQEEDSNERFVGPLVLNGQYYPSGLGIFEIITNNLEK